MGWRRAPHLAGRVVRRRPQLPRRLGDAVEGDHDRLPARRVHRPARQTTSSTSSSSTTRRPALRTIENVIAGPMIAVLSFVCSIGNVPLAAVLWSGGISFAGVMAFIFADLIVLPIVIAYRKYYGRRVRAADHGADVRDHGDRGADRRRPVLARRPDPDDAPATATTSSARSSSTTSSCSTCSAGRLRRADLPDGRRAVTQAARTTRSLAGARGGSALTCGELPDAARPGPPRHALRWHPIRPQLRKLAIVPAYNEEGMVGRVVREIRRQAPGLRRRRRRRRLHRRDRRRGGGRGSDRPAPPVQPRDRRARCSPGSSTRSRTATTSPPRSTATASTSPPTSHDLLAALHTSGDEADMVCGSRFRGDPGYKVPIGRRVGNLIFSVVLTAIVPPADHRPDLGLPDDQPARDRAVRPRLPARLPRGRGDPDAARPPPARSTRSRCG